MIAGHFVNQTIAYKNDNTIDFEEFWVPGVDKIV